MDPQTYDIPTKLIRQKSYHGKLSETLLHWQHARARAHAHTHPSFVALHLMKIGRMGTICGDFFQSGETHETL